MAAATALQGPACDGGPPHGANVPPLARAVAVAVVFTVELTDDNGAGVWLRRCNGGDTGASLARLSPAKAVRAAAEEGDPEWTGTLAPWGAPLDGSPSGPARR